MESDAAPHHKLLRPRMDTIADMPTRHAGEYVREATAATCHTNAISPAGRLFRSRCKAFCANPTRPMPLPLSDELVVSGLWLPQFASNLSKGFCLILDCQITAAQCCVPKPSSAVKLRQALNT